MELTKDGESLPVLQKKVIIDELLAILTFNTVNLAISASPLFPVIFLVLL